MTTYDGLPRRLNSISFGLGRLFNSRSPVFSSNESGGGNQFNNENSGDGLGNVGFHEVRLAKQIIGQQLFNKGVLTELREHFMCNLYLDSSLTKCPPQIFGRVISLYPDEEDNYYQRPIELITMRVPRLGKPASILDIPTKIVQNYPSLSASYINIPIWVTPTDMADLEDNIEEFWKLGIYLDLKSDFEEFQELSSIKLKNKASIPWILIVTSDWLSAQTRTAYQSAYSNLKILLIEHGRSVINYHPRPGIVLNEDAGYVSGRTKYYFLDAYSVSSLLDIVDNELNGFLNKPLDLH
jgi:hypothetical protein